MLSQEPNYAQHGNTPANPWFWLSGIRGRPAPPYVQAIGAENWGERLMALPAGESHREMMLQKYGWSARASATDLVGWVSLIFNRLVGDENPVHTHAIARARRFLEGAIRVIPLSYLEDVDIPGDIDVRYAVRDPLAANPLSVKIPLSGPPIVSGRKDLTELLRARQSGYLEIDARPFYV